MNRNYLNDMTQGSPVNHILGFSIPLLAGNLFQQLYNMVDSIVVGNYVGANALAAVGACGSLNFLFFALSSGIAIGIGVIVSQYFGAGDEEHVRKTIANSIYILSVSAVTVSILGMIYTPWILTLLDTPDAIFQDAVIYMRTTCAGIPAIAAYNGIASILRALGDSKTPLKYLIFACILNVILDLLFVLQFDMAVFGVALATIISQLVSAAACVIFAYQKVELFRLTKEQMVPEKNIIINSVKLGIPIAFQNSLIAISCLVLQRVVNGYGETVVAAFTITSRVEQFIQQPYASVSMAVSTFTGQNVGAGRIDRVREGFRKSVIMSLGFSILMLPVAFIFGEQIVSLFVREKEVVRMGATALKITSICYFPLAMIYMPRALMNGAGDAAFAMINGLTEVACRIGFSVLFASIPFIGHWGVWITTGATWTVTAIVCLLRYFSGVWINKGMIGSKESL
ncbi:MAG: MATE family efflux transporter [Lachnospiraceae bacterium]|nr:MATE family efflux transporter [Lachnospiraceae bacterium]